MWILDTADTNVKLSKDGEVLYSEPGLAIAEPRALTFGYEALTKVRLKPDAEQSQYWQRLDQSPVHPTGYAVETQADLVYRQLLELREKSGLASSDPIWMAVPGDLASAQIALLYGIAVQAQISVRDFVDRGVAAAANIDVGESCAFVDVGLHRTVVSQLDVGSVVTRERVSVIPRVGLLPLLHTWIRFAADRFLDSSRFDPRKFADTEQQVFDRFLGYLKAPEEMYTLHIEHLGDARQIEFSHSDFANASYERLRGILAHVDKGCPVLLTAESADLPGMVELFEAEGSQCYPTDMEDLATAVSRLRSSDDKSEDRVLHVEIPHTSGTRSRIKHEKHELPTPTHVVKQSIAQVIGSGYSVANERDGSTEFKLQPNAHGFELVPDAHATVLLNGEHIFKPTRVKTGDLIMASSVEYHLIAVESHG